MKICLLLAMKSNLILMKQKILVFFFLTLSFFHSYNLGAQDNTISGYVTDSKTGEQLIDAGIYDKYSGTGTYTNEYGFFSLSLKADSAKIVVYYIGYKEWTKNLSQISSTNLDISLVPVLVLDEVVVSGQNTTASGNPELHTLSVKEVTLLPGFVGEKDFMKTMHLLPGVNAGSEGSSSIFVRGGGDGQNLILLDGVPVYNTDHVYGFLSVFNSSAISYLNIYKGGFPARYGGRLSSVIDVRMKEGNLYEYHGNLVLGPVSSSICFEGPVLRGKTSFMIAIRRTLLDIITRPFMNLFSMINDDAGSLFGYYFYDANFKINHAFSNKDRVFLSFYSGKDKLFSWQKNEFSMGLNELDNDFNWGNITAVARWNHIYGDKLFSNTGVSYSRYKNGTMNMEQFSDYQTGDVFKSYLYEFNSQVKSLIAQLDWDWRINPANNVRFGINYQNMFYVPGSTLTETLNDGLFLSEFSSIPTKQTNDGYVYFEDNIKIKKLEVNVGVNLSACMVDSSIYPTIQPRIRLLWNLGGKFSIFGSYSEMTQNIHMLTRNNLDLSTDLWLPSTSTIKPMYAKQGVAGCKYEFNKSITASFETYYKKMNNLIEYREGANYIENQSDWESLVTAGSGKAYGVEFLLEKKSGTLSGWISYTLSKSTRKFEELNGGKEFPFKYDRLHNFSIVAIWNINENVNLSATWVYYTGTAYTLTEGLYPTINPDGSNYGYWAQALSERNGYRMPDYHRLDISANFSKIKKRGTRIWSIGIYNLYNRQNPYFMYLDYNDNGTAILKQVCFFPIMPSFSYSFSF